MAMPVIIPIVGLFLWGATFWLLVIGLFFEVRYITCLGAYPGLLLSGRAMDKAADAAGSIKKTSSDKSQLRLNPNLK